jgi:hypothetical protein
MLLGRGSRAANCIRSGFKAPSNVQILRCPAKLDDPSNLIIKGGPYPRPQITKIAVAGGDKPRPYFNFQVFINRIQPFDIRFFNPLNPACPMKPERRRGEPLDLICITISYTKYAK